MSETMAVYSKSENQGIIIQSLIRESYDMHGNFMNILNMATSYPILSLQK